MMKGRIMNKGQIRLRQSGRFAGRKIGAGKCGSEKGDQWAGVRSQGREPWGSDRGSGIRDPGAGGQCSVIGRAGAAS
jgi:hypothetical protein